MWIASPKTEVFAPMNVDDPDSPLMKFFNGPEHKKGAEIANQIAQSPNVYDLDRRREEKELDNYFSQGGSVTITASPDLGELLERAKREDTPKP